VRIRADSQGGEKGHYFFEGFVDLHKGDIQLQADRLDLYETDRPEGGQTRKVVAEGNVVFARGDERLAGQRVSMDVDTGQGTFEEAYGFVQPGIYIEAKVIERVDPDTYRIEGGKFTACAQPNPRWSFSAARAKIELNNKIIAKNAVFEVKDIPTFYFPYFVYPINDENRATGFLPPHVSTSSIKGTNYGDTFFWAMGRSFDQTFYFDHYQLFDEGYGHEFRYALDSPSNGLFREYAIKPGPGRPWDWDITWNALQMLPLGIKGTVVVRRYSNLLFERSIQETLNFATTRTERESFSLTRSLGAMNFSALTDSVSTFSSTTAGTQALKQRHLPSFAMSRTGQKIGSTPFVFGFDSRAEQLAQGDQNTIHRYSREDFAPWISAPFQASFLQINPKAQVRYTRWGASLDESQDPTQGVPIEGPVDRRYFEGDLNIVGPTFSRVYNNPSGFYSDKFKHTIGPEINFTYRTEVPEFASIPKFDGVDEVFGTNQISYALVQHFFAKRPAAAGGKPQPYEFLTWRVGQTYYVQVNQNQNSFDPNYASSVFGPGGVPSHNSPLQSQLAVKPSQLLTGTFNVEYDVNFNQLRTLSAQVQSNSSFAQFSAGLAKAETLNLNPAQRTPTLNTVRSGGTFHLIPHTLDLNSSVVYDVLNKNLIEVGGRVRYDVQCCGFLVEYLRFDVNGTVNRLVRFSIQLANVGGIGTFFGQDPTKVYPGLLSYR
jgi:LPS-assembly protein